MSILTSARLEAGPAARRVAERFVEARKADAPLARYPGEIPGGLAEAYACQDAAISMWSDKIAGWKIGRIDDVRAATLGSNRLAGPIFARSVLTHEPGRTTPFEVFTDGFAAIEAEFIFVLAADAPADKRKWSLGDAKALIGDVRAGVELAGSPLKTINDLGPTVIVSDFGNNAGLILGDRFEDWRTTPESEWTCETLIDGARVGAAAAAALPGGPIEALRFLLELSAARGRPLKKGDLVSSGAVTGVHEIQPGQEGRIAFAHAGEILCRAEARNA